MCKIVQYKGMAIIGPIYRSVISSGLPSQHKDHYGGDFSNKESLFFVEPYLCH